MLSKFDFLTKKNYPKMQHNSTVEPKMWISDGQGHKYLAHGNIPLVKLTLLTHFKELN